jgi:hypothetical protein
MLTSPTLDIYSVVAITDMKEINIPISLSHNLNDETIETETLLDSGAGGIFIDQNYARQLHLEIQMLDKPVVARNIDGTINK